MAKRKTLDEVLGRPTKQQLLRDIRKELPPARPNGLPVGHRLKKHPTDDDVIVAALYDLHRRCLAEQGRLDVRRKRFGVGWTVEYGMFTKRTRQQRERLEAQQEVRVPPFGGSMRELRQILQRSTGKNT